MIQGVFASECGFGDTRRPSFGKSDINFNFTSPHLNSSIDLTIPIAIITISSINMAISSKLLRISSSRYSTRFPSSSRTGHTTTGSNISDHEAFNYTSGR